ncbi:galectin [Haematobia irritans]|uniref:galectin n=1 Tax=Haematobia irritans TaxID=7368 RepID=UPI003F505B0B
MAALVFCLCSAVNDLYVFTNAFQHCNCDYRRTLKYLRYRKRIHLFYQYLREFHLDYNCKNRIKFSKKIAVNTTISNSAKSLCKSDHPPTLIEVVQDQVDYIPLSATKDMHRTGIDFAAIEASAEAFEVIDSFAIKSQGASTEDFLQAERVNAAEFRENYYYPDEIEIIEGFEDDTILYQDGDDEPVYQNPSLGRLHEGISFTVKGRTKKHCERFSINFIVENATRDVALHINPRLPQNYIVRNTKVRNAWGREEVASALPFSLRRGAPFSVQVLFTDECYMISVNGYHFCKFYHRLPYESVQTLEVKGEIEDVTVDRMEVQQYPERLPESVPQKVRLGRALRESTTLPDVAIDETDRVATQEKTEDRIVTQWRVVKTANGDIEYEPKILAIDEIKLPYYGTIPLNSFQLGRALKVEGRVRLLPQSFYINMQSGHNCWPHPIVALHLNPRFTKQTSGAIGRATVIRNSWIDGNWGQEEKSDLETKFLPGKPFSLAIVHAQDSFKIYVNHQLLTEYKFRVSPKTIDTIYIQGDIKLFDVALEPYTKSRSLKRAVMHYRRYRKANGDIEYEPKILAIDEIKLPYYGTIPLNSFQLGRALKVEGRVRLLPQSFYINMQSGHNCWPHPIVALHLNPRFTKQTSGAIGRATVIRNSWIDGNWGQEEKSDLETKFLPGKPFSLAIVHAQDSFKIYVNHQLLTEYKFRVSPKTIDTIYIQGDIKLFDVALEPYTKSV